MASEPNQVPAVERSHAPLSGPSPATADAPASPQFSRGLALRVAETAIFLIAVIGAAAIGLGITGYFSDHKKVFAYLIAYAGFCFADLLVREDPKDGSAREELSRRIAVQSPLLVLFALAPMERTYLYGGEPPGWLSALGLLVELIGIWLALGARMQLGFFAASKTPERPVLVTSGLFRYVRHPGYAGIFLVMLAWPLEYGAPIAEFITLITGIIAVNARIAEEEAELRIRFGEEYENYVRTTDTLIPGIW
ncbi:MAG TPA: isoprenylcysteine carboxylmethyltransferase family protein [Candidatus Binataceae bacterium]|nr:isoprenylcysteine carboxylmethyltransferase family protein [Candidatus Binataceae bacterium]